MIAFTASYHFCRFTKLMRLGPVGDSAEGLVPEPIDCTGLKPAVLKLVPPGEVTDESGKETLSLSWSCTCTISVRYMPMNGMHGPSVEERRERYDAKFPAGSVSRTRGSICELRLTCAQVRCNLEITTLDSAATMALNDEKLLSTRHF